MSWIVEYSTAKVSMTAPRLCTCSIRVYSPTKIPSDIWPAPSALRLWS